MNMNEGLTEIRPATADEQIRQWTERQAEYYKALNESLCVDGLEIENIGIGLEAHVYGMNVLRAMAKANGCAWRIVDRNDDTYPWRMEIIVNGVKFYAIGEDEDLTPDELKYMKEQEA